MKAPSIFISHGSPMLILEDDATAKFLKELPKKFNKPSAVIVFSAHWETASPQITAAEKPETIHDFYGFPDELYEINYPANGNLKLSKIIKENLSSQGIDAKIDHERGFDHGVWSPVMLMFPKADIPIVQISVQPQKDARWHFELGRVLAYLREENIMIIGSGNLTHNLMEAFRKKHHGTPEWVTEFSEWVATKISENNIEELLNWDKLAPYAKQNHPTTEHFLPLFAALGAASDLSKTERMNKFVSLNVLAMDSYIFY